MCVDYYTYHSSNRRLRRGVFNVYSYLITVNGLHDPSDCTWIVPGTLRFEDFA